MTAATPESGSLEREVKLRAGTGFVLPELEIADGSTVRRPEQRLNTAYFDTVDLRLWCRGITLRHRSEEGTDVGTWTVKLPAQSQGPTLDRTELCWNGPRGSIPAEARRLLSGIVRTSPLNQIVELATIRHRLIFCDAHGTAHGELDDDTVTVIGGDRDGVRFRQIELELGPGGDRLVDRVLKQLRHAGARRGGKQKLATAVDLSARLSERPVFRVHRGSSMGDVAGASIATGLDRLLENDYRIRLDPSDPPVEGVHQARVATRRLRSELKMFASVLDPVWVTNIRLELKWLGEVLGRVRDADVLALLLGGENQASSLNAEGLIELRSNLADQRKIHCRELASVLDDARYLALLDRLEAATQALPSNVDRQGASARSFLAGQSGKKVLPRLVCKRWLALRREVRRAGQRPSDLELHRMRIRAKELRYGAEAAATVIGKPARRTAAAAEAAQNVLGDHHDAVSAEEWLERQAMPGPLPASYAAGRLAAERTSSQHDLRRRWRSAWNQLDQNRNRCWL